MKRASGSMGVGGLVFLGVSAFAGPAYAAQDGNGSATPPPAPATVTVTGNPATPALPPAAGSPSAPNAGPVTQKDQAKKPADAKKPAARPFAGTQLFVQTSANLNTFAPALQPDRNVTVDQSLWFLPRYNINDSFQLRGRLIFNYEYTNSDTTTKRNEPRFNDPTVQLFYKKVPSFGGGFKVMPFVSLGLPLSPESQARTMIMAPGLGAQLSRGFEHVLGGELLLLTSATYSHPFYTHTTAGLQNPPAYAPQCFGGSSGCTDQANGVANVSDSLNFIFLAAQEWGKWSPAVFFLWGNQWAYQFKDLDGVSRTEDRTSFRQSTYFSAWLDYNANEWLTAEAGYFMARNMLTAQGKIAGPEAWIFDKAQDMRVYLGFNVNLDNLAKVIEGKGGEGGVVRAKNRHMGPLIGL